MDIPLRYQLIVDDMVNRSLKYLERGRVPASTLIKGGAYSGAIVLVHEILNKLLQADKGMNVIQLRVRLTDKNLSSEISRELMQARSTKKPVIFTMDGVDRILNLPSRVQNKSKKVGRNAKVADIIEESHRLRKILLENSNKVSLISSAGLNINFMEDPDLPFYKFFNEITISPLSAEESAKHLFSLIKKFNSAETKNKVLTELGEISYEWPYKITGGNWLLIQKFHQVISTNKFGSIKTPASVIDEYFLQLYSVFLLETSALSREERRFVEGAALLSTVFSLKDLNFDEGNASLVAKNLVEKGILSKIEKTKGEYKFCHTALRTFIRYFTKASLVDVFSDELLVLGGTRG